MPENTVGGIFAGEQKIHCLDDLLDAQGADSLIVAMELFQRCATGGAALPVPDAQVAERMPILALEHIPFPGDVQAYLTLNDLLYLSLQARLGFLDLRPAQGLRFPDPPFERCLPLLGPEFNSIWKNPHEFPIKKLQKEIHEKEV